MSQLAQECGLAGVGRPDEDDLRAAFLGDVELVLVLDRAPDGRLVDQPLDPLAQLAVGAVVVAGELAQQAAQDADALGAFGALDAAPDDAAHLLMWNGHGTSSAPGARIVAKWR